MNKKTERQDKNPAPAAPEATPAPAARAAPAGEPQRRGGLYQMSADGRRTLLHRTAPH